MDRAIVHVCWIGVGILQIIHRRRDDSVRIQVAKRCDIVSNSIAIAIHTVCDKSTFLSIRQIIIVTV